MQKGNLPDSLALNEWVLNITPMEVKVILVTLSGKFTKAPLHVASWTALQASNWTYIYMCIYKKHISFLLSLAERRNQSSPFRNCAVWISWSVFRVTPPHVTVELLLPASTGVHPVFTCRAYSSQNLHRSWQDYSVECVRSQWLVFSTLRRFW